MQAKDWREFLLTLDDVSIEEREGLEFYSTNDQLFAVVAPETKPLQVSLRCDTKLAKLLRAKYESVLPGQNLDPYKWNTILVTGQLEDDELRDLAVHAYQLVYV